MFEIDAAAETLPHDGRNMGAGTRVNLERALKIGDELGGHIVTGHVDGVARIISRDDFDDMSRFLDRRRARCRASSPRKAPWRSTAFRSR